jgi:pyruvate ferredoxin oxidoreductase beta subunit
VESYLSIQGRYRHLFSGSGRPDIVARIQGIADQNIAHYGLATDEADSKATVEVFS